MQKGGMDRVPGTRSHVMIMIWTPPRPHSMPPQSHWTSAWMGHAQRVNWTIICTPTSEMKPRKAEIVRSHTGILAGVHSLLHVPHISLVVLVLVCCCFLNSIAATPWGVIFTVSILSPTGTVRFCCITTLLYQLLWLHMVSPACSCTLGLPAWLMAYSLGHWMMPNSCFLLAVRVTHVRICSGLLQGSQRSADLVVGTLPSTPTLGNSADTDASSLFLVGMRHECVCHYSGPAFFLSIPDIRWCLPFLGWLHHCSVNIWNGLCRAVGRE